MPADRLTATFSALADPTRRAILARLISGEASVTSLAEPFAMSLPAISKHLKVLERAGLVRRTHQGRENTLELRAEPLQDVARWVSMYEGFWKARLDRLEKFFLSKKEKLMKMK